MKGARRNAREAALKILYQLDFNHELTPEAAVYHFERNFTENNKDGLTLDEFTQRLVSGVAKNLKEIDTLIEGVSEHWRTGRMPAVDRNILRIGVFELLYCDDIPATVSINEMIEVAKGFGSENSASFVNGILDKIKATLNRPNKAP